MKTTLILSFLAALAAFALSLISLEVAVTLLSAVGILGIMSADYSRRLRVPTPRLAPVLRLPPVSCPTLVAFELAA